VQQYKITYGGEFEGTLREAYSLFRKLFGVTREDGDIEEERDGDKTTLFMDGVGLTVTYEPVTDDGEERR
jgi:hypothetical protein